MTKVFRFSRLRFIAPAISVVLLVAGILVTFLVTGINLGIDFEAGINVGLQIAPVAMTVSYTGDSDVSLNIRDQALSLQITSQDQTGEQKYPFADYPTLGAITDAMNGVEGLVVESKVDGTTPSADLLALNYPYTLGTDPVFLNVTPTGKLATIDEVRSALTSYGTLRIQMVGAAENQEFQVRVPEQQDARDFSQEVSANLKSLLEDQFGKGTVIIRQTDYVGARLSQNLAQQTAYLSIIALALILVYTWFRFKLAYAVSAIVATLHDTLFMFIFVAVTGMEFSTATIAAVLTIIGYSLNDTIVIFDRIRENVGLMRNASIIEISDTSITQSLSRTLMTSLTTLLAIVALYIFGTGTVKDFALAVIFGIIVGTYSSNFIASPILIGWTHTTARRKRTRDAERYGSKITEFKTTEAPQSTEEAKPAQRKEVDIPVIERKLKGKRKGK